MHIVFRYYMVYYLALSAEFNDEENYIIPHSSQLMNHNCAIYTMDEGKAAINSNDISINKIY